MNKSTEITKIFLDPMKVLQLMSFSRSNATNYVSYKNHILLKEDYLAHILDSIGVKYY